MVTSGLGGDLRGRGELSGDAEFLIGSGEFPAGDQRCHGHQIAVGGGGETAAGAGERFADVAAQGGDAGERDGIDEPTDRFPGGVIITATAVVQQEADAEGLAGHGGRSAVRRLNADSPDPPDPV